jgi:DNA-binding NarL/FixJ family response regulator
MTIRLLLIDDNTLFRKGLAALLAQRADMTVLDDFGSGHAAAQASMTLQPDVIIMDMRLSGSIGLDIAEQIKRRQPQVKVLMLTASRTEEYVRAALHLGIDGYVLKDASLEELLIAVRSVARGKKYLSPDV